MPSSAASLMGDKKDRGLLAAGAGSLLSISAMIVLTTADVGTGALVRRSLAFVGGESLAVSMAVVVAVVVGAALILAARGTD